MALATYRDIVAASTVRKMEKNEALNNEGGIVFAVDQWARLRRFLILGTEGGTFYAGPQDMTIENVGVVKQCLADDAARVIDTIVEVSQKGLAPKNEPAILALAMATIHASVYERRLAYAALPDVCRTGTHLLHFAAYREALGGGWGKGMRRAVGSWFISKTPTSLAYQAVKYKQRDGWSMADLLRLSHPKATSNDQNMVMKWIVDGVLGESPMHSGLTENGWEARAFLAACMRIAESDTPTNDIRDFRIPREALPTELLNRADVWEALLADMPMTAMIRNLGKMTKVGVIGHGSTAEALVVERLRNEGVLKRARAHPIAILAALKTYEQGHGMKGSLTWTPAKRVINALDEAFYLAFQTVPSTGKRIRLALDVSSSMVGNKVNGMEYMDARTVSAAMALVTAAREPNAHFVAYSHQLVGVDIRPSMRLDEVMRTMSRIPYGGTLCSLPIVDAISSGAQIDAFVSYTDSETFEGGYRFGRMVPNRTPSERLNEYRMRTGIWAKHAVCAVTSTGFSIADPNDPAQLDIVGFSADAPAVLGDFIAQDLGLDIREG